MSNQFDEAKIRLEDGRVTYDCVKLAQIETEGIWLRGDKCNIPQRCEIRVRTKNTLYSLKVDDDFINAVAERNDNHTNYLPLPMQINIHGSTWGGSMLKMGYIGVDMHLEFSLPNGKTITTSAIESLTVLPIIV